MCSSISAAAKICLFEKIQYCQLIIFAIISHSPCKHEESQYRTLNLLQASVCSRPHHNTQHRSTHPQVCSAPGGTMFGEGGQTTRGCRWLHVARSLHRCSPWYSIFHSSTSHSMAGRPSAYVHLQQHYVSQ